MAATKLQEIDVARVMEIGLRRWDRAAKIVAEELQDYIRSKSSRPNPTRRNPSAQGEYPKYVSGNFMAGVRVKYTHQGFIISSVAPHGKWLQFGTPGHLPTPMAARPYVDLAEAEVDWSARVAALARGEKVPKLGALAEMQGGGRK
jgi:hypothetical protein